MRLTDEELREVLARAEELERGSRQPAAVDAEFNAVVEAGVSVGLARSAVEQALRERGVVALVPPALGELAYVQSADGNFYAATVLAVDANGARVRFLRGSEHSVTLDQVRPFSMIPGERVVVNWPWWGPWTCTVVAYDAAKQRVKLYDGWGEKKVFPVAEVWQAPQRPGEGNTRTRVYTTLLTVGASLGAVIGALAMWFLK